MTMVSSEIIALECLALLRTPLLGEFLDVVKARGDAWADQVVRRLIAVVGDEVPHFWAITITARSTPGLVHVMSGPLPQSSSATSTGISSIVSCAPIASSCTMCGTGEATELPADDFALSEGDILLLAGDRSRERDLTNITRNVNVASDVILGDRALSGFVWRTLRLQP